MQPVTCPLCYLTLIRSPFDKERYEFLVNVFGHKRAAERFDEEFSFDHVDDYHDRVIDRVNPKFSATFSDFMKVRR